jgi:IclR family acetate operon transcriptional repressor
LKYVANSGAYVTVKEVAQEIGVDPSTSSRLMSTLEKQGLLQQDPRTHAFRLGIGVLELANSLVGSYNLGEYSHDVVRWLASETGEGAHLAVLVQGEAIFLDRAAGRGPITVHTEIGARDPVYCTAIGRALLSGLSDKQIDKELADIPLKRMTRKTVTSLAAIVARVEVTRAKGYAFDDEERHPGVQCIAAPVRDHSGHVVAAIGISGPTPSIQRATESALATVVLKAAGRLTAQLGGAMSSNGRSPSG